MANNKETNGAWIIHHGRKIALDSAGPAEFPAIDEAAKAAVLIAKLGQADDFLISMPEVKAIGAASGLNPRHELSGLLQLLERRKLVEVSDDQVSVLGMSTRGALIHASDIFNEADPSPFELASIVLAERASDAPVRQADVAEELGDTFELSKAQVSDFLGRSLEVGFVDKEGVKDDALLFNGNLFRRGSVEKSRKVLDSLNETERRAVSEVSDKLSSKGCMPAEEVDRILSKPLFEKLIAAGLYDLNQVENEDGSHVFVTSPSAFHKFVDPFVDDCFDLAKALVAALMYGMTARAASRGRIQALPALLGSLLSGREIGPATAIGEDYRVLEMARVVQLRPDPRYHNRFYMKLLKRDVGELALQVLTQGNAYETTLVELSGAPMTRYQGPEANRTATRRTQTGLSHQKTRDVLEALRGGRIR